MDRIVITCNNRPVGELVTTFVESKFVTLFDRYDEIVRVRVELNLDSRNASKLHFRSRVVVELREFDIVAESESEDAHVAIYGVFRKAESQLHLRSRETLFERDEGFARGEVDFEAMELPGVSLSVAFNSHLYGWRLRHAAFARAFLATRSGASAVPTRHYCGGERHFKTHPELPGERFSSWTIL
ncbi:HPF/RaiA family ribosome-associated protein [Pelagicoccus sp. SDUM812002]|uniref:HPF/RaiA family ribosome-associated protein n=1 Tax=Pelagicoccus sp. SDUM812002 TaxID=3041266 RepID=UPI0034E216D4